MMVTEINLHEGQIRFCYSRTPLGDASYYNLVLIKTINPVQKYFRFWQT